MHDSSTLLLQAKQLEISSGMYMTPQARHYGPFWRKAHLAFGVDSRARLQQRKHRVFVPVVSGKI